MTTTKPTTRGLRTMLTQYIEAWNAHDVETITGYLTEDVVWQEPGTPEPLTGRAAAAQSLRDTFAAFPDLHLPMEDLRVYVGEDTAHAATSYTMLGTMTGRLVLGFAPTGKAMRVTGSCLYELRDGKIARHTIIYDSVDAMQQLGLLPSYDSLAFKAQGAIQTIGVALHDLVKR